MVNITVIGSTVPEVVSYYISKGQTIISSGTITSFTASNIPNGFLLGFEPDLVLPVESGQYLIVYQAGNSSHSEPYVVEDKSTLSDQFTISDFLTVVNPIGEADYVLYQGNETIASGTISNRQTIDLASVKPSMIPLYCVIQNSQGYVDFRVWKINPSIMTVMKDLRSYVDRLNMELRLDALRFADTDYLLWLEAGMNRWNGLPFSTTFDMTHATGAIRDMWLLCSQIQALRTKYLEEGLSSFNYSGAAVQLDFDVTPHIESVIQALETRLQEEGSKIKTQLYNTNQLSGPGTWRGQNKALGTSGMSLGPVAGNRQIIGNYPWFGR